MQGRWRFDKTLNIGFLAGMVLQTAGIMWWGGTYTADNNATNLRQSDDIRELKASAKEISDMKADVAVIKSNMVDIKAKLDRIK